MCRRKFREGELFFFVRSDVLALKGATAAAGPDSGMDGEQLGETTHSDGYLCTARTGPRRREMQF